MRSVGEFILTSRTQVTFQRRVVLAKGACFIALATQITRVYIVAVLAQRAAETSITNYTFVLALFACLCIYVIKLFGGTCAHTILIQILCGVNTGFTMFIAITIQAQLTQAIVTISWSNTTCRTTIYTIFALSIFFVYKLGSFTVRNTS